MSKQTMVQELKSERVQEELVAPAEAPAEELIEVPFRAWLKSERVQEPTLAAAAEGEGQVFSAFELMIHQQEPMKIELLAHQIVITLNGSNAGLTG